MYILAKNQKQLLKISWLSHLRTKICLLSGDKYYRESTLNVLHVASDEMMGATVSWGMPPRTRSKMSKA